jgi:hypothetical protein
MSFNNKKIALCHSRVVTRGPSNAVKRWFSKRAPHFPGGPWIQFCDGDLLTPWSRVLLEKLTGFAASQQISRIYGTPKFITVPTSARQLSLS